MTTHKNSPDNFQQALIDVSYGRGYYFVIKEATPALLAGVFAPYLICEFFG